MTADKAGTNQAGLVGIDVSSGTAMDGPGDFRGFVHITATAEDGSTMEGQLPPSEVRMMALNFLSVAEAAEQDAIVFRVFTRPPLESPPEVVAAFVRDMRREREL